MNSEHENAQNSKRTHNNGTGEFEHNFSARFYYKEWQMKA